MPRPDRTQGPIHVSGLRGKTLATKGPGAEILLTDYPSGKSTALVITSLTPPPHGGETWIIIGTIDGVEYRVTINHRTGVGARRKLN